MEKQICIGILYPGDMGAAIAKVLISKGLRVISVSEGRSEKTKAAIKNAGIEDVKVLNELAKQSDFIFSLTSPNVSLQVAQQVATAIIKTNSKSIFVDLNSNNPQIIEDMTQLMSQANIPFINGAVMGAAQNIPDTAVIILSGKERHLLLSLLSTCFHVKDGGDNIISAVVYKLLFAMVNKGMNALFFETMTAAAHFGILDELNESLQDFLPGTYQDLIKTTPTYPQHIRRRIDEMNGLAEMLAAESLPNDIALAAAKTFQRVDESAIMKDAHPKSVLDTFQLFKKENPSI